MAAIRRVAAVLVVALVVGVALFRFGPGVSAFLDGGGRAEVVTAEGEQRTIRLADGTTVRLNGRSALAYPKRFQGKALRAVHLEGEAYFDVAANPDAPFVVATPSGQVRVEGTAFNVRASRQADGRGGRPAGRLVVAVTEGAVALRRAEQEAGTSDAAPHRLRAGEVGVLSESGFARQAHADIANYRSWATGRLRFTDAALPEVARQLGHLYGTEIVLASPALERLRLTARLQRDSLGVVLGEITAALGLAYEREAGGAVRITQK